MKINQENMLQQLGRNKEDTMFKLTLRLTNYNYNCNQIMIRKLLFVFLMTLCCCGVRPASASSSSTGNSARQYNIHWNSSNPIFRIDATNNIFDVNQNNSKFEYDQVNLICPVYSPGTKDEDMEKYIIYNVSKDEYETCRITTQNPKIIAICDKPNKLMYFTITFRPFTPQPGGLEFLPGHDYYFISTSANNDIHRRIGGKCSTHNMKIVFKVWAPPSLTQQQHEASTKVPSTPSRPLWSSVVPTHRAQAPPSVFHPSSSTHSPPSVYGGGITTTTTKKSKAYDKHPNEVVKSEELTLGGANSSHTIKISLLLIITTTTIHVISGILRLKLR